MHVLVQCTTNVKLAVAITMVTGFLPSLLSEVHMESTLTYYSVNEGRNHVNLAWTQVC